MSIKVLRHEKFDDFLAEIRDGTIRGAVLARITRLGLGNPGDSAPVGGGVFELRIHVGAGWRVYYGKVGEQIILLVGGGTKNGQQKDIEAAQQRLDEYRKK
jgi:putative addiction module killer protein